MDSQNSSIIKEESTSSGTESNYHHESDEKNSQDYSDHIPESSSQEKNLDLKLNISVLGSNMGSITLPKHITQTLIRANLFLIKPSAALAGMRIFMLSNPIHPSQELNKYSHSHFTQYQQVLMPDQNYCAVPIERHMVYHINTIFIELYKFRNLCSSMRELIKSYSIYDMVNKEKERKEFVKKIKEIFSALPDTRAFSGMIDYMITACPLLEDFVALFPSKESPIKIKQYVCYCGGLLHRTKANVLSFLLNLIGIKFPAIQDVQNVYIVNFYA